MGKIKVNPGEDFSDQEPVTITKRDYISEDGAQKEALREKLRERTLDYSKHYEKQPIAVSVNGKPLCVMGDLTFFYGKAKSKKTFLASMGAAAALGGKWGIFEGHLPADKSKVLIFDTEQSDYNAAGIGKRITRMIGHKGMHENLMIVKLRGMQPAECIELIEFTLQETPGVGLVIIDGIKELVRNINDQDEATFTATTLLRWCDTYNFSIITVIHENKANGNARGAIGSELMNKCWAAINIENDPKTDVSKVEVTDCRELSFDPFGFMVIEETGMPEVVDGWKPKTDEPGMSRTRKGRNPDELTKYDIFELLSKLKDIVKSEKPKYSDIKTLMGVAYRDKFKEAITESRVREYVSYFINTGNLFQHGTPGSRHSYYEVIPPESPYKGKGADQQGDLGINVSLQDQAPF